MFFKAGDIVIKRSGFYKYQGTVKRITKTSWGRWVTVKPEKWFGENIPPEYSWRHQHNATELQEQFTMVKAKQEPKPTRTKAKNGKWIKCLITKTL